MAKLKRQSINSIRKLLSLIQNEIDQPKKGRGRPKTYPDSLIILSFFIKTMMNLSYRDTIYFIQNVLKIDAPSISDLHYRFSKLDEKLLKELFEKLLNELNIGEEIELIAVDGTGFGYGGKRELNWMRGAQIRKVSSHVKVELIVGKVRDRAIILGVNMGEAYSDERKLLMEILEKVNIKAKKILADALYGMSKAMLEKFYEISEEVIVPVRDTLHTKVRSGIRKKAKIEYEDKREEYKQRYFIEQVIGKIKNAYGRLERTKSYEMARKHIWAKMILYNWAMIFLSYYLMQMLFVYGAYYQYFTSDF